MLICLERSLKQKTCYDDMEMEAATTHRRQERSTPEAGKASGSTVLNEDEWDHYSFPTSELPSPNTARRIEREILADLSLLEGPHTATSQSFPEEPSTTEEYPRQLTVWLKGDGFDDEPFDFPKIPVPGPTSNQNNKTLWGSTKPVRGFL